MSSTPLTFRAIFVHDSGRIHRWQIVIYLNEWEKIDQLLKGFPLYELVQQYVGWADHCQVVAFYLHYLSWILELKQ